MSGTVVQVVLRCADPKAVQARLWGVTFPFCDGGVEIDGKAGQSEVVVVAKASGHYTVPMVADVISRRIRSLLRAGGIHDKAAEIVSMSAVRDD